MNRSKSELFKKALKIFGRERLLLDAADMMLYFSAVIKSNYPDDIDDDFDFFDALAEVNIYVERLIEMLDLPDRQRVWTAMHSKLDKLRDLLKNAD